MCRDLKAGRLPPIVLFVPKPADANFGIEGDVILVTNLLGTH
jgi:hypothetical protein